MMKPDIVVGLDVGTSKVCAVVAEIDRSMITILGTGISPAAGLRKGIIISIDAAVDSIRKAIREAEVSSGVGIKSVSVTFSGAHIKGFASTGAVGIRGKEVRAADVARVIESAQTVYTPLDREVLHIVPTEFKLDGQEGITDPVGMRGVRLEVAVYIITGAASSMQNLLKCCEKAGVEISEVVCEPFASAESVLTSDEKQFGTILIDIGGGTTGIALFKDNSLRHASVIGIGGNHLTNDIAVGLRIPVPEAERLKKVSGAAFGSIVGNSDEITIVHAGGQARTLPRSYLVEILQPRCEEMLELIKEEIRKCSGYETAICGVVLTGGASLLNGFDRMTESVLGLPVRVGSPENVKGLWAAVRSPLFSSAVGLIARQCEESEAVEHPYLFNGKFGKMKDRIKDLFKYTNYLNFNNRKEGGIVCLKSKK
jgi:cell division protein FtsA